MIPIPLQRNMKSYLQNLWDNIETLFAEMIVEGKDFFNFQTAHGFKTTAIY